VEGQGHGNGGHDQGTLNFESEVGKGTRAVVRLPGIDDTIGNDAEGLASKIRLGR
jgi:hypothetical protein